MTWLHLTVLFKIHTFHTYVVHWSIFHMQILIHANQLVAFTGNTTYSEFYVLTLMCETVRLFKIRIPKALSRNTESVYSVLHIATLKK